MKKNPSLNEYFKIWKLEYSMIWPKYHTYQNLWGVYVWGIIVFSSDIKGLNWSFSTFPVMTRASSAWEQCISKRNKERTKIHPHVLESSWQNFNQRAPIHEASWWPVLSEGLSNTCLSSSSLRIRNAENSEEAKSWPAIRSLPLDGGISWVGVGEEEKRGDSVYFLCQLRVKRLMLSDRQERTYLWKALN